MPNLCQREQARALVASLERQHASLVYTQRMLDEILGRAQNAPPHGESDGTLTGADYDAFRGLEQQLTPFIIALARAARV